MSFGDEHDSNGGAGQTRTRLPEAGNDVYGGARRPVRNSRSLITVVGVVTLLIAAIAFANRGDGADNPQSTSEAKGSTPTAATGVRPVKGKDGAIATGYAKDEQGAQSAAANYAVALVSADILKPDRRSEIVRQLFVASKVSELETSFDKAYSKEFLEKLGLDTSGNAAEGLTYVSRTAPVGTKITRSTDNSATIEVWCTGVFGIAGVGSTNPVTNDWFTMTLSLQWTGGDWKVASFSQKEGPAPVNADRTASSADDIAKAVEEFGGFTYAR
ncbi:hypothetical protein [Streptomyces sp. FIT100]|uniref:hypothetical protein n=1 Tax=Streptomyces sp. FIT100 TaxID=2837956 RepID=UPI0021C66219|nr:hypothetical protein [Streptomyces sp. FIT100]UUN27751.1 hypothetical protein KK483_16070 [Streptomyces sp. FIT100]